MTEGQTPPPASPPPPIDYGAAPSGAYQGPAPDKDAITMGMLCHLLGIFTWFLGPLLIWLMKKDTSPFVDDQGKESLNFQLTTAIACVICVPLIYVFCLGAILMFAVHVIRVVLGIMGTLEANKGIAYRYPLTFRLIK